MIRKSYKDSNGKIACPMNGTSYLTLKGKLTNWTSEDIVKIAKDNIETIIEPIREDLAEQTYWNVIGSSTDGSIDKSNGNGILEFKKIGENSTKEEDGDYEWEIL